MITGQCVTSPTPSSSQSADHDYATVRPTVVPGSLQVPAQAVPVVSSKPLTAARPAAERCGHCEGCSRTEDCGSCSKCSQGKRPCYRRTCWTRKRENERRCAENRRRRQAGQNQPADSAAGPAKSEELDAAQLKSESPVPSPMKESEPPAPPLKESEPPASSPLKESEPPATSLAPPKDGSKAGARARKKRAVAVSDGDWSSQGTSKEKSDKGKKGKNATVSKL